MEEALERRIKYYEDDARRYEEQADEVASRGYPTMTVQASNDEFDLMSMRWCLPVAAVINYRNDFTGFYNHISQVVYFHYPNYERTLRCPFQDASTAGADHMLPALCLLHPTVKILYEEDHFDITKPLGYWAWIVLPGKIYLAGPNAELYHSSSITALLQIYLGGSVP